MPTTWQWLALLALTQPAPIIRLEPIANPKNNDAVAARALLNHATLPGLVLDNAVGLHSRSNPVPILIELVMRYEATAEGREALRMLVPLLSGRGRDEEALGAGNLPPALGFTADDLAALDPATTAPTAGPPSARMLWRQPEP